MSSTLGSALKFVHELRTNDEFRKSLYRFETIDELSDHLKELGLFCSFADFENAINSSKLKAADEIEDNEIDEIKNWWQLILGQLMQKEEQ